MLTRISHLKVILKWNIPYRAIMRNIFLALLAHYCAISGVKKIRPTCTNLRDRCRGFIRAECFSYDNLMACGSEKGIRDNGHFRLEGKNYKVKDGDILNIRFSI